MVNRRFGVAFGGGGIRSAAFCSGALRRLIFKDKEPDVVSCVSGGGYTGSAYVQWKYHKGQRPKEWAEEFFNQMRKNTGHYCNWSAGFFTGCWDSFVLILLVLFIMLVPIIILLAFSFPIAFVVKFLYGHFLDGESCREDADDGDCIERKLLFVVSLVVFVFFHLVEYIFKCCESKKNYTKMKASTAFLKLGQLISGNTFAFTFFPWFIHDFLQYMEWYEIALILLITALFWFFVPVLRKYSSLVFFVYIYSYVVHWHLYKDRLPIVGQYTDDKFKILMLMSIVILALLSILGGLPQRLVYMYNRWRLQRAFYRKEKHCYCYDCFPGGHCCHCCPPVYTDSTLTLEKLEELIDEKPLFISNIVANNWRKDFEKKYCLLTMSSRGISVIDKQPENPNHGRHDDFITSCLRDNDFADKLKPKEIKLSSAMAMSAAAVSQHLGKNEDAERQFTHCFTVFGIEMATDIVYNMTGEGGNSRKDILGQICLYFANFAVLCLILGPALYGVFRPSFPFTPFAVTTTAWLVGFILLACLLLSFLTLSLDCLECSCACLALEWEQFKSWCVVHLPICRFFRSLLSIITYGETPPALLHLSDGGHFENYGLLVLLKMKLPKILILHGSEIKSDEDYAKDIINAMEHARKLFNCSFTTMNGSDVLTDLKNKYVNCIENETSPRKYEFKVQYSDETTGHIVLIAPRPPTNGDNANNDQVRNEGEQIEIAGEDNSEWHFRGWGGSPYLRESDVELIAGCLACMGFCECCHSKRSIKSCCGKRCFTFPRHPTANQFYTPRMFTAYHREGYRACMECDDFLRDINTQ